MRQLQDWPRPAYDTGIGLHLLSKAGNQFYCSPSTERDKQIALWQRMGVSWLLVLTDSDSQLEACRFFRALGIEVILRPYHEATLDVPPVDLLKKFADVGVRYSLPYANEPEIELPGDVSADKIDKLARATITHADNCAHAGLLPVTASIQGDRAGNWFEPLVKRICELGRKDALEGSAIGVHNRPANHPVDLPPPGFVFRSYETFDDVIVHYLGQSLPIFGTEAGYEPYSLEDTTFPMIGWLEHSAYNAKIAQADWRPALFCQCFWSWADDWFRSGWYQNRTYGGNLPVVQAFCDMAKPLRTGQAPEPPIFDVWPEEKAIPEIREWCWNHLFPGPIEYNASAAFQLKAASWGWGAPCTKEGRLGGWACQGVLDGILYCKDGEWSRIKSIPWYDGAKVE